RLLATFEIRQTWALTTLPNWPTKMLKRPSTFHTQAIEPKYFTYGKVVLYIQRRGHSIHRRNEGDHMKIEIGIKEQDRGEIAQGLSRLLADTYTLYLKTHNFHWNVTGPMFQTLHLMFETQYNELALAVDLIAERIRALGYPAPGTYSEYSKLSSIKETAGVPKAEEMIRLLV